MKRLQNRISESRFTLPVVIAYGVAVWLTVGPVGGQMWISFACFAVSIFFMMELDTGNALMRIYSRMVPCAFVVLSVAVGPSLGSRCGPADGTPPQLMAQFLSPTVCCSLASLCVIVSYMVLFRTYQNRAAMAGMFYGFLFIGLASMLYVEVLYYVPALWLLSAFCLQAASWRNFFASVFGLIAPYWFAAVWFIYNEDFSLLIAHFARLGEIRIPAGYTLLPAGRIAAFAFVLAVGLTGTVHYVRTSYNDKIRVRMLYNIFIVMNMLSVVFIAVQPQHYDFLISMMIINTSPLAAHFIALTRTRLTNISFYLIAAAALLLTGYNLWTSSSIF